MTCFTPQPFPPSSPPFASLPSPRFRALAELAGPDGSQEERDGAAAPQQLLELVAADPNADIIFAGWEKLRTSGAPGVDLAVHKALTVVVAWAGIVEPLARLGAQVATKTIKTYVPK